MIFEIALEAGTQRVEITAAAEPGVYVCTIAGRQITANAQLVEPGVLSLLIDGRAHRFLLDRTPADTAVCAGGQRYAFTVEDPRSLGARKKRAGAAGGVQIVKAPMPGRILRVMVTPGQEVAAHEGMIVVEAMKMQNELKCPKAGRVKEVRAAVGDTVQAGQALVVIE